MKFGGSLCPVTIEVPREWTDCGISTTEAIRDIRRVPGLISLCLTRWEKNKREIFGIRCDRRRSTLRTLDEPCFGKMLMGTILLIVLILLVIGALPTWPYSAGWGYYPTGGLGLLFIILLVLVLLGRI